MKGDSQLNCETASIATSWQASGNIQVAERDMGVAHIRSRDWVPQKPLVCGACESCSLASTSEGKSTICPSLLGLRKWARAEQSSSHSRNGEFCRERKSGRWSVCLCVWKCSETCITFLRHSGWGKDAKRTSSRIKSVPSLKFRLGNLLQARRWAG